MRPIKIAENEINTKYVFRLLKLQKHLKNILYTIGIRKKIQIFLCGHRC